MPKIPCAECTLPCAEMQGGVLVIKSRHAGVTHVTALTLTTLWLVWYNEDAAAATEWLEMQEAALVARQRIGGQR